MSTTVLSGCEADDKSFYGDISKTIHGIGSDMFGTGETGPIGGAEVEDAEGNAETQRFDEVNIKKVEDAPKQELADYDFEGPENSGITSTDNTAATGANSVNAPAGTTTSTNNTKTDGTVIVLAPGHADTGSNKLEFHKKAAYLTFAKVVCGSMIGNSGSVGAVRSDSVTKFKDKKVKNIKIRDSGKGLLKVAGYSASKSGATNFLKEYGFTEDGSYTCTKYKDAGTFYNKVYAKFDKLVKKLNDKGFYPGGRFNSTDQNQCQLYATISSITWVVAGTSKPSNDLLVFKGERAGGATFGGVPEYKLTLWISQVVKEELESKGYSVCLERENSSPNVQGISGYSTNTYSNRTIARMAKDKFNGTLLIAMHFDHKKHGFECYYSSERGTGKEKAKVFADAFSKGVKLHRTVNGASNYTMLNWARIPSVILEHCYTDEKFIATYGNNTNQTKFKKKFKQQIKGDYLDSMVKAIEAATSN